MVPNALLALYLVYKISSSTFKLSMKEVKELKPTPKLLFIIGKLIYAPFR